MKPIYNKVTIVGMGLMGGSLGLSLLDKKIAANVTGLGRNIKRLQIAKSKGAATQVTTDYKIAITGANLVIIALPVMMIPVVFNKIKPYLSKTAIVTDMGSVKGAITEKIALFDTNRNFVGSHPMVGSEKAGIEYMKNNLYEKGVCIVTASAKTDKKKAEAVNKLWRLLGMRVIKMSPLEHDKCTAAISHFPHLAAFAMVAANEKNILTHKEAIGPGFKDSTRIAASNEELWAEIIIMNKTEILKNMKVYLNHLVFLSETIEKSRISELKQYIKKSRILRESIK
ncbi:MAG: prephenate dehydrogenase [bacterium]